ncbi:type III pantothenate kinase [Gramella sp. Hel_I_59]|uniref:type III pantothenate kinase n=1 Tax=Gramella sp. Hel_I_59 TaxID=1249978 RepID=UPI00114FC9AC|nr:type III pantothenate kinase [Gramella sp. Hel_I_59]TQI69705.1 type III pantothenate kinase [Gramella sp. Hel_I_59]
MNLVLDAGNTSVKAAVYQNDTLQKKLVFLKENFSQELEKIFKDYPQITHSILSEVTKIDEHIIFELEKSTDFIRLSHDTPAPFQNKYHTPHTLGLDRIALVAAAIDQFPKKNVLIIDAGTCITFDLKTAKEIYLGGAISPGLQMRFKSLHKFTANLPLVSAKPDVDLIGKTTESSIQSGIINGLKMELKGVVETYASEFEDLTVIFTGGDSQLLSIPTKNSIFANSNFLLEGLNFILEFNKTQ